MVKTTYENIEGDVVIIGGGGAGLPAAISAKRAGAKNVIILEKTSVPGGNAALSHGIFAAESPAQKRQGLNVFADKLFIDRMEEAEWKVDPELSRDLIYKSKEILKWLADKGLVLDYVIALAGSEGFESSENAPRVFHMFEAELDKDKAIGTKLIDTLVRECGYLGVKLLCNTTAKKIINDKYGRVKGVLADTKDGSINITANSVIIAAGGFAGNKNLIEKYFPSFGDVYNNGLPHMTGDGILMAAEAGAADDDQVSLGFMGPHHYPWAMSLNLLLRRPHVMLVNKNGERYIGSPRKGGTHALNRQPGKICYALLDSALLRDIIRKREVCGSGEQAMGDNGAWLDVLEDDLKKESAEGKVKIAETWEEIAEYTGAKPEVLKATVERYNSFCDKRYDEDFLKESRYLIPLRIPPYYAVLGRQGFDGTGGGIKINSRMEVLDKQGSPVAGLYAAGDNAAGFLSIAYKYPGQALAFALYSGFASGENAAKFSLGTI